MAHTLIVSDRTVALLKTIDLDAPVTKLYALAESLAVDLERGGPRQIIVVDHDLDARSADDCPGCQAEYATDDHCPGCLTAAGYDLPPDIVGTHTCGVW